MSSQDSWDEDQMSDRRARSEEFTKAMCVEAEKMRRCKCAVDMDRSEPEDAAIELKRSFVLKLNVMGTPTKLHQARLVAQRHKGPWKTFYCAGSETLKNASRNYFKFRRHIRLQAVDVGRELGIHTMRGALPPANINETTNRSMKATKRHSKVVDTHSWNLWLRALSMQYVT